MPSFQDLLASSRKKASAQDKRNASARFREILKILHERRVGEGLTPQKAVDVLEDLGATFVKLGQIASTHPDMLPPEYCEAFGALRSKSRPLPVETVKEKVASELGRPLEEAFSDFDDTPLGSASIAQVHRAVLAQGGQTVAVKVQRPGVVEQVTQDLAIMERLVDLYGKVAGEHGRLSVKDLVDELVRTSESELDFTVEADNLERFAKNNGGREGVSCPRCYADLCRPGLLVEDFAAWPAVEDAGAIEGFDADAREKFAYLVADNYVRQMLEDGFYHADPHAGNVLVTGDAASGFGVEWIDFGMMGKATKAERAVLGDIVGAVAKSDAYALKRAVLKVATPAGSVDHGKLLASCEDVIDKYMNVDLVDFDTGALVSDMMGGLQDDGYEIAPFPVALARGLVTLEGTIHSVSPQLNIMRVLVDYLAESFDAGRVAQKARRMVGSGLESAGALAGLPSRASETLDMLQKGQVKIGLDFDLERKAAGFKAALDTFSLSLIAAALFIGSCIMCTTSMEPRVLGVPFIGAAGFACGLALAVYVFAKIFRDMRRR